MANTTESSGFTMSEWIEGLVFHAEHSIIPVGCWAFQMANVCLAVSLYQTDILYLRVILLLSNCFFMIFGGACLNISIDTVGWNAIFAVIQVWRIVPLILDRIPPNIDLHKDLYNEIFNSVGLSRKAFKILIDASVKKTSIGGDFIQEGDPGTIVLIHQSNGFSMLVKRNDAQGYATPVSHMSEPRWAGLVSYALARRSGGVGMNCNVLQENGFAFVDELWSEELEDKPDIDDAERLRRALKREALRQRKKEECATYYEWTFQSLDELYRHPFHGDAIRNALDATLFAYSAYVIAKYETDTQQLQRIISCDLQGDETQQLQRIISCDLQGDEVDNRVQAISAI